mgnify:CR=1 FL=1
MLIAIGFADFPTQLHTAWHRIVLRNHASETDGKILGKTWHINWAKFGQNRTNLWHKKFPCIFSAWERKKGDEIRRRYFIIIQSLFCIYSIYKCYSLGSFLSVIISFLGYFKINVTFPYLTNFINIILGGKWKVEGKVEREREEGEK